MAFNLLKGKKGIIFGALDEKSIAWKAALKAYEEGASIVLTNAPIALRMGTIHELSEKTGNAPVIGADATSLDDLENLYKSAMENFGGGVDFILHSIGMSPNVRKGRSYGDLNFNLWLPVKDHNQSVFDLKDKLDKCFETSNYLITWSDYYRTRKKCHDIGLAAPVTMCIAEFCTLSSLFTAVSDELMVK